MWSIKSCLLVAHRWLSLILFPLFLLLVITGGILAFRPVIETVSPTVDGLEVAVLLAQVDPQGTSKTVLASGSGQVEILGKDSGAIYELATGNALDTTSGRSFFDTVKELHKKLFLDLDWLVEFSTYAMLGILLVGPLLAWIFWRNSLLGWHVAAGWCLFPIIVMIPFTAVLMELDIGKPTLPTFPVSNSAPSLEQALTTAANHGIDISSMLEVRSFKKNTVLLETRRDGVVERWLVAKTGTPLLMTDLGLSKALHEGRWGELWANGSIVSGLISFFGAVGLSILVITGAWSLLQRKLRNFSSGGKLVRHINNTTILVAHASQTGTAIRVAKAISTALIKGGNDVVLTSLSSIKPDDLQRAQLSLLIVSTAGDGDVPDTARSFMTHLDRATLDGARFALMALGDSHYPRFCGGGRTVRSALKAAGAEEVLSIRTVDGEPRSDAGYWLDDLAEAIGLVSGTLAAEEEQKVCVTLAKRIRLDNPDAGDTTEAWELEFSSLVPMVVRPGDLMVITPATDTTPRFYSLGGAARPGCRSVSLTVALNQWQDEQGEIHYGQASGLLCRTLQVGNTLDVVLRPRTDFNPPDNPAQPIIMIASGCGIAPFTGFLTERSDATRFGITPGPAWMIFGNRYRNRDYLHQDKLETWKERGVLTRLDLVFSRDGTKKTYVQNVLEDNADEVLRWIKDKKAIIYVCGRAKTMGVSIEKTLIFILERNLGLAPDAAKDMLLHWRTDGTLRFDLFG